MKRAIALLLATAALGAAIPAVASAQTVNERHHANQANIESAVRAGLMSRATANALLDEHRYIGHLRSEYLHSGGGINERERVDLQRRLVGLDAKIDRYGPSRSASSPRGDRDDALRLIDRGVRNGGLTQREAQHLRAEYSEIGRLEQRYRANGLTNAERREVEMRLSALTQHIRVASQDDQYSARGAYGYQR